MSGHRDQAEHNLFSAFGLTIGGALGVGLPMTLKTPLSAANGCVIEILW
jgi:hypothetical protein